MLPSTQTASFFLPGLVHQFGNLLLTVQGHVLHLEPEGIPRMQDAVLGAVNRGSASLQVLRVLLGEHAGATGSAFDLLSQVVELGRVPARECGVSLELRGDEPEAAIWVRTEPFVLAIAEALQRWIQAVRTGSSGVATVSMRHDTGGQVLVQLGFEPETGSLPFPMPAETVAMAVSGHAQAAGGTATAVAAVGPGGFGGVELRFATGEVAPTFEA